MARILIFSGPPASRKTTTCKIISQLLKNHSLKPAYISDTIILEKVIEQEEKFDSAFNLPFSTS